MRRNRPAPPKKAHSGHRQVELTVERIGGRGDGLATYEGHPVFVPQTVPGDRVRVKLLGERAGGITAEVLELVEPGPLRAEPGCALFGRCGGCALQHVDDAGYAAWKRDQVETALRRAGVEAPVEAAIRTPEGVRRRATFAAKRAGGKVVLGFNERMSHWIVPVERCLVIDPAIEAVLPALRTTLDAVLPDGPPADVSVAVLDGGLDVLVTGGPAPDLAAREAWAALAEGADLARLSWRAEERAPVEPLAHRRPVFARFGDVAVPVAPGAFLQASPEGEAALVAAAGAALAGAARIIDLFSGAGTFTFPLARKARVHAVEGDGAALDALAAGARGIPGITVERRDLVREPVPAQALNRFDGVLFDPPRAGAARQAEEIARSNVPVVVGVSCNPATFGRDARVLVDGGYRLERVTPVDQFLWSPHVELVGVFRRG
ncbi:class I SAM-dependent RNA methyltransferase [Arenibaculum pallidiluteum]|uniref:class I SAM-dependent RNA methyltransferase n=1 Tax=Arenibaculum pallidiluteum TaxID=2812559 RepID=UPI001A97BDAA|nr:class I SAM-dependent RNA methyltransferase [Arenibaculum pallidiluteum]